MTLETRPESEQDAAVDYLQETAKYFGWAGVKYSATLINNLRNQAEAEGRQPFEITIRPSEPIVRIPEDTPCHLFPDDESVVMVGYDTQRADALRRGYVNSNEPIPLALTYTVFYPAKEYQIQFVRVVSSAPPLPPTQPVLYL